MSSPTGRLPATSSPCSRTPRPSPSISCSRLPARSTSPRPSSSTRPTTRPTPRASARLEAGDTLAALRPDMNGLEEPPDSFGPGFNVFAGSGTAYTRRMFAPADGVPEDPATGSAAGPLACHLLRHDVIEPGTEVT